MGELQSAGLEGPSDQISGGPCSKTLIVSSCPSACEKMSLTGSIVRKPTMHRYISTKVLLAEGRETSFTEHCRNYENMYRVLQADIQNLKDQVQELHRDLTKHHSLIKTEIMSEILQKSLQMDVQIASEYSSVEMMRSMFEETWEETYQRVANEQEIYEAQLHDLLQLKQENSYLTTITKQIAPYVRSIAKVKERLEPRLQEAKEKDSQTENLLKIYDDSTTTTGDVLHRTDSSNENNDGGEKPSESKAENQAVNLAAKDTSLKSNDGCKSQPKGWGGSPPTGCSSKSSGETIPVPNM